ncbi:mannose-6-phosphate isomerase [Kaistia algarum]|nr:mannose-6-phosphate isomerase [Kaistia algarum]
MRAMAAAKGGKGRAAGALGEWLVADALPFWAAHGVDRKGGGFFERIEPDGTPIEEPRRARLVARQIYCFAIGQELGWGGPAGELVRHGLDFLLGRLVLPDGTVLGAVAVDGSLRNDRYDPYDYAFVLFGLAAAAKRLGDRKELHSVATRIRERLVACWAHPYLGFEEASPRTLPLKSNPHMHLFEAFLAWDEIVGTEDPSWRAHADRIGELALTRLILPETGALPEFFDGDWRPMADAKGLQVEPGHQFEWAWLLLRWLGARRDERIFSAALRLAAIGERFGVSIERNVAFGAIDEHFHLRDGEAKLWPQTERLKAWHGLAGHRMNTDTSRALAAEREAEAEEGLMRYLDRRPAGIWHEIMAEDGSFLPGPVRASSLYHIACAAATLAEKPA